MSTLLLVIILLLWALVRQQTGLLESRKTQLAQSKSSSNVSERFDVEAISLPILDSAKFVDQFHSIAEDMHLPLDEVQYAFESSDRSPFLKYRMELTARAGYGEMRRFLAAVSSELPNVTLDAIQCGRNDVLASALDCKLSFSAFFSKVEHG
jgi:hypothetical protein